MVPASTHAGTTTRFDVVRSGSAHSSGAIQWVPLGVSSRPTQLPQQTKLGDVQPMVMAMFKQGLLVTKAAPKNDFWEIASGMLGPAIDLVAPGLNALVGATVHSVIESAIETRAENRERAEYVKRTLDAFVAVPFLDVSEIDWREAGSTWSLRRPARHLTIVYLNPLKQRDRITLVTAFPLKNWVSAIFRARYNCEVWGEHQAVLDSLVDGNVYVPMLARFNETHPDASAPGAIDALIAEYVKTRTKYLTESGVTDEIVRSKTVERSTALLDRYRGLPELDGSLHALLT